MAMDVNDDRRILLGKVVGVHGIQGWVKIESHTQPRSNIFRYVPWTLRHRDVEYTIEVVTGREQGKGLVAHWAALEDRNQAEALIGAEIWVPRGALPPIHPDEYYWADLVGLRVIGVDGFEFGRVSHLFTTGANDVMSVMAERERLIPFLKDDVIKHVDLVSGLIEVDWDPDF